MISYSQLPELASQVDVVTRQSDSVVLDGEERCALVACRHAEVGICPLPSTCPFTIS